MHLSIDSNNILGLDNTASKGKKYSQILEGFAIETYDRTVFVEHKKNIKQIQFKDIGSSMQVFYIPDRESYLGKSPLSLDQKSAISALSFYKGYDEDADKNYSFLYKYPVNNINILNTQLGLLGIHARVSNTEKGLLLSHNFDGKLDQSQDINSIMTYFFILTLLYGRFDIKGTTLFGIKIHMHLFGPYLKEQTLFDTLIYFLQNKGIFLQKSINEASEGIIYQINSNDHELLSAFAQLHKSIAKIDKISTLDKASISRSNVLLYIDDLVGKGDLELDQDLRNRIENGVLKLLEKR